MPVEPAKTEVTTQTEQGAATPTLDERILKSVEANAARFGATKEGTSEETTESDTKADADADTTSDEAKADTEAGAETEAETDGEDETDDHAEWTDEEMSAKVAEDPKFFSRLDKDGWARVPAHWARAYKSTQALLTDREQRVAQRERELATTRDTNKADQTKQPAKQATADINTADLVDALNDPERVGEAAKTLFTLPGVAEALDRWFEQRTGVKPETLAESGKQTVFEQGYDIAVRGSSDLGMKPVEALSDKAILDEIENNEDDPRVIALLKANDPATVAFGWELAAKNAQLRLGARDRARDEAGRFVKEDPKPAPTKDAKVDAAKKILDAKARANAKQKPSAAVEPNRSSVLGDDDPSLSLDERIARKVNSRLQSLGAS